MDKLYQHLSGSLRHTDADSLENEMKRAGVSLDADEYLVIKYEDFENVYLCKNGMMEQIADDYIPHVAFNEKGERLQQEVQNIIDKEFGY